MTNAEKDGLAGPFATHTGCGRSSFLTRYKVLVVQLRSGPGLTIPFFSYCEGAPKREIANFRPIYRFREPRRAMIQMNYATNRQMKKRIWFTQRQVEEIHGRVKFSRSHRTTVRVQLRL